MKAAITAEVRKLFSTRIWWLLLIVLVGYLAFMGAVVGFSVSADAAEPGAAEYFPQRAEAAKAVYATVNGVGYVFPLIIGSLVMTGEFRHKTITQSLLVEPRRTVFLAAKLVAAVLIGLLYGVVATLTVVLGAAAPMAIQGDGTYLSDTSVLAVLGFCVVVTAIWASIGVGIGALLTNQVAAIVTILGITQFIEPILRVALASFDATAPVSQFLPAAAADAAVGASYFSAFGGSIELLPRPAGLAVMLAYAAAFALIARFTTLKRDLI